MWWVWWILFRKEGSISRRYEMVWRIFARSTVLAGTSCSQDMVPLAVARIHRRLCFLASSVNRLVSPHVRLSSLYLSHEEVASLSIRLGVAVRLTSSACASFSSCRRAGTPFALPSYRSASTQPSRPRGGGSAASLSLYSSVPCGIMGRRTQALEGEK
jgi:hypothetical protein